MEAASVAAFAVVAPLTISGYAHLKDCLRTSGTRVGQAPTLFKDAFADPRQQLRIVEPTGSSLGGNVTLSVDGQPAGSYLVFNGEIILVGDNPSSLKAVAAIGGAKVTSQAQTVSVVAWEAPRELKLQFSSEKEAGEWAKALREAAKLPQYPSRLDMLMDHIHMQDMQKIDLQHRVEKAQEERLVLECKLKEAPSKEKVAELEAKVRETSSALHSNKARADAVEEALKEHKQLLTRRESMIQQAEVGTVYRVESDDPRHKADHNGLAYRRSMNLEDKVEELAPWGTTVKGIDVGNGWVQVGEKFLPVAVGNQHVLTPSDSTAGSFQEHVTNLNRELQLALQKKDEAEERHQVSVQQVEDLKHAVAQVATAGGHQELLDKLHAAEANTSGASRELLEMFEAAEVRKLDLEERARALEERLASLEGLRERPPEPAARDASAGFVLDAVENEDHVRMLEMAEARRAQLEDRTREIELQMARIEQMRQQELEESPKAADTSALTARISQLEAALLEKDQDIQQHLHHLEEEKRAEAQRLLARTAQLEAACAEKGRQAEELRAQLAEVTSHQASGRGEVVHEDGLQAMLLHVAEVHGRAQAQASQAHEAAEVFERHATELDRLRQKSGEAAHEAGGPAPGELQRLRAEAAAAARDAEAARAEQQASLQRAAEAEARAEELEGALVAKEGHVAELLAGAEQRDQEITKLAQALEVQQPPTEVVAPQLQNDDMEELCQRASLAEAKVAELSAFIQDQDAQTVQLSATVTAMEEEIMRLRSAQPSPDVEELRASVEEREAERTQLIAGVTAMEQEIMQLQAQVAAQERGRDVQLAGGAHEELTNRAAHAEAKAAEFEDLAIKREEELTRLKAMVEGTEQELTNRIAHAEARATEFEELAFKRKEELIRLKAMAAETEQELLHLQAEVAAHEAQSKDRKPAGAHEELTSMVTHAQARAAEFEELAIKREEELSQLKVTVAEMEQELTHRAEHGESRAAEFQDLAARKEEELSRLKEAVAGMEQELNHRAHGEGKVTEFQELGARREEELFQLKEAVAAMEQELTQRADADARAVEFEELAIRREEEVAQLKETIAGMEQELNHRAHGESTATEFQALATRREEELFQLREVVAAMEQDADRRAVEFEELANRKEEELAHLKETIAGMEQEVTHRTTHADRRAAEFEELAIKREEELTQLKDTAAGMEQAQLQRVKEAEANALAAQALIQQKDLHVSQLKQDVNSLEQELANLQAQQEGAHQVGQQALVQQTALTEAHMQTAKRAEETAAQFRALADEKARHVERLELSAGELQQELAQLRAAAAKRAEEDAAGRRGLLEQARAAEDIARAEGRQEKVDEARAREEQRAERLEEEKAALQRQLEAQFEVEYAAVKRHAAEAQKGFEASCLERDALKSQLEQAQSKEEQRSKFFEEEKATLRRHLAEQFETEYSAIQRKATEAELELRNLFLERDSLKKKLEQAPAAEQELPAAVVQRLASTEMAAEEAKAKLQLAEQELRVAYQTIERQSQEHAQLHSRRSQAQPLEAQLAQLEQDKLALQEQLAQRTAVYNRELEDVRLKMKLLEEALMTASGVSPAQAQASLESLSIASKPHAAEHSRGVLGDTPTSTISRHGFGDDLPGAVQHLPEVTSLNVIPSIQVTSPPQLHRYTAEAMQQPQIGAAAAAAGLVTAHGFVGGQQPHSTAGPPPVPISSMVSPITTVSPMPSFAGSMQGGSLQASAAPLQSLVLPNGAPSPMQLRAQEPLGAGPMLPCAAWQMQTASPLASPLRQRPQEPNPAAATAVVVQRAASPAMHRPLQPAAAPAPPIFAMQAAAAKPMSRAAFAATGPGALAAAAPPRVASARGAPALAAQPAQALQTLQTLPATIRQLSGAGPGSWSGHPYLDKLTPPSADRGSRQLMADVQPLPRSPTASFDPSGLRQVPMGNSLRSDSGATLSASMAQAPEMASLLQPAAPCGGIIGSVSHAHTDFQSMRS